MFNQKIIFIDIDGTLMDTNEYIPESASLAIEKARQKGHKIYLSTGRSMAEIQSRILNIGFDGVIGGNGCYIEVDRKAILEKYIPSNKLCWVMIWFGNHKIKFYTVSNQGIFTSDYTIKELFPNIQFGKDDLLKNVMKINFIIPEGLSISAINDELSEKFAMDTWNLKGGRDRFCELSQKGINKKGAIITLLNHIGADRSNTMCFGDGLTDKSMLEYCRIGIAMGNANEEIKKIADYNTTDLWNNGIYNGFKHFGLL